MENHRILQARLHLLLISPVSDLARHLAVAVLQDSAQLERSLEVVSSAMLLAMALRLLAARNFQASRLPVRIALQLVQSQSKHLVRQKVTRKKMKKMKAVKPGLQVTMKSLQRLVVRRRRRLNCPRVSGPGMLILFLLYSIHKDFTNSHLQSK